MQSLRFVLLKTLWENAREKNDTKLQACNIVSLSSDTFNPLSFTKQEMLFVYYNELY